MGSQNKKSKRASRGKAEKPDLFWGVLEYVRAAGPQKQKDLSNGIRGILAEYMDREGLK